MRTPGRALLSLHDRASPERFVELFAPCRFPIKNDILFNFVNRSHNSFERFPHVFAIRIHPEKLSPDRLSEL